MKIIVLGGGMVGSTMALDLSGEFDITCADHNPRVVEELSAKQGLKSILCDASDSGELKRIIEPFDLVIGAVPGYLGFSVLRSVIEAGRNVVDISFFPEDAFILDELARQHGVTAVVDCGVAPGMCNMIAGYHDRQMKISSYACYVGGLPVVRKWPYEYRAPFSPADVLEEYTRPARLMENGRLVVREALSEVEYLDMEPGTLEAFNTDGLRTLLQTMPHIPEMKEKTLRYPGHAELMRIFRESGFFSGVPVKTASGEIIPLDLTSTLLFADWKYLPGEKDFTVMLVKIEGTDDRGQVSYVYTLYDRYDDEGGVMSMARTTGFTATAVVRYLARYGVSRKGILAPEQLGSDEQAFHFIMENLKEKNVVYRMEEFRQSL